MKRHGRCFSVGRPNRVGEKGVLDVREQELLVLLLVVHPEHEDIDEGAICVSPRAHPIDETKHVLVDVMPIDDDLFERGPA